MLTKKLSLACLVLLFFTLSLIAVFSGYLDAETTEPVATVKLFYSPESAQKIVSNNVVIKTDEEGLEVLYDGDVLGRVDIETSGEMTVKIYEDNTFIVETAEKMINSKSVDTIDVEVDETPAKEKAPDERIPPSKKNYPNRVSEIVRFGSSVAVDEEDLIDGSVVVFGGSVTNKGYIERDLVCIGGSLANDGYVGGSVVCVGGSIALGPNAYVQRDAVSVGGSLSRADGAVINGQLVNVGIGDIMVGSEKIKNKEWSRHLENLDEKLDKIDRSVEHIHESTVSSRIGSFFWRIFFTLTLIAISVILILFFPDYVHSTSEIVKVDFWKSFLVGIVTWIALLPVFPLATLILIITCIGVIIPPIVLFLLWIFGFSVSALATGKYINNRFKLNFDTNVQFMVLGVIALMLLVIMAKLVAIPGGPTVFIGGFFAFFGWIIFFMMLTTGMGAVILSKSSSSYRHKPSQNTGLIHNTAVNNTADTFPADSDSTIEDMESKMDSQDDLSDATTESDTGDFPDDRK